MEQRLLQYTLLKSYSANGSQRPLLTAQFEPLRLRCVSIAVRTKITALKPCVGTLLTTLIARITCAAAALTGLARTSNENFA